MPCKVLSFDKIHTTSDFFKDCNECVNLNYRKQLEQVEDNALYQQLKVDQMYWKERAEREGTEELVNMYNRFNKMLAIKAEEERVNSGLKNPQMRPTLEVPFNYEVDIGPMRMSDFNSNNSTPTSLRSSVQNRIINRTLDSAESAIRRIGIEQIDGPLPTTNPSNSNINRTLDSAESLIRRVQTPSAPAQPARPTLDMNELRNSIAASLERRSRGSRSNSIRQLSNPSSSAISNASSVLDNVAEQQRPQRGRPTNIGLTSSEVRGLLPPTINVEQPTSGSGLRKKAKKKVLKKTKKSNLLM